MIMKLGQNFCLGEISEEYENGSCQVKNLVAKSNLEKPCVCPRDQIFGLILMKLGQSFASMKSSPFLKMGHVGSKTRSLGEIIKNLMLVNKGLWFKSLLLTHYHTMPHFDTLNIVVENIASKGELACNIYGID